MRRRAERRDHVWTYDFVADRKADGRPLKLLVAVDEYSRECLAIEVARRLRSDDVLADDVGYILVAAMIGDMTEELLIEVAESVRR